MAGPESSAVQLLKRAVELDKEKKYGESLTCYEQGIRLLLQAAKDVSDQKKKDHYLLKVEEYLARAETLKKLKQEQLKISKHTQVNIPKDGTGFSYAAVFGPYFDGNLTEAALRDPYIRSTSQLYNLQRFCETLVHGAPNLKKIYLLTSKDQHKQREAQHQAEGLEEMRTTLALRDISFSYSFSDTLHDREIRLNNGWTIQIGRGLDYFQRLQGGRFAIGSGDYNLRPCLETTIDIFHNSTVKDAPR